METILHDAQALCLRLSGHEACHQLVSRMCRDFSLGTLKEFASLWLSEDNIMLTAPWGSYCGPAGIARFVQEETPSSRAGILDMHCALTECLEVARDGKTARGCWMFQAITSRPDASANWLWYKADIYFAPRPEGGWGIRQMALYPMYDSPFDSDWGKEDAPDYAAIAARHRVDIPAARAPWHLGDPVRLWECYPPKAYDTWNDTVMGREPK